MVQVGVVEERFGGNAADIEAGTAEGAALLDTGNLREEAEVSYSSTPGRGPLDVANPPSCPPGRP